MRALVVSLVASLLFSVPATVFAQDVVSAEHPYRDPQKARVLATILPGAGYAYTGEYLRAYGTWFVTAAGLMVGPVYFESDCYGGLLDVTCGGQARTANIVLGSLMIATSIVTWVKSVRDAPKSAERANERHRRRELELSPTITIPDAHNRVNAGLSVAW
jgi:hypothetical protein